MSCSNELWSHDVTRPGDCDPHRTYVEAAAARETAPAIQLPGRVRPQALAPLISGAVLNPINSTIIAVALVPIGVAFGEPASATAWLISSLYLATAVGPDQVPGRNLPSDFLGD